MKQIFLAICITILTSLYFCPFESALLPSVNTKMALAAFSIVLYFIRAAKLGNARLNQKMIYMSLFGFAVSMFGYISTVINNTSDYTYASYFVSMWVWIGGAYVVVKAMEWAYGNVTIRMVGNFLIAVCVAQCILAQLIDANDAVKDVVDSFMVSTGYMGKHESRLYGIGCALDVAGLKFCTVLLMNALFLVTPKSGHKNIERCIYMISFIIIAVYGSMIARTTNVGVILAFVLWIMYYFVNRNSKEASSNVAAVFKVFVIALLVFIPILVYLYNTDPAIQYKLRFAFEGFFSLYEKGEWDVGSNSRLEHMFIWPDNIKTWVIGDGYFSTPQDDYYYLGPIYDYYMGTDVGYSRFLFYFGILGLVAFSLVFIAAATICSRSYPKYTLLFWMIVLVNFVGWIKVSSDIFLVFALFLCVESKEDVERETIND